MAEPQRAACVCNACNARKKACDKALPTCGSCAKRNLPCRYDITARARKAHRAYNPGRHFVAIDVLSSSDQSVQHKIPSAVHAPASHKSLSQQVLDIIGVANLAPEDISELYFRTFHQRCPIIAPKLFNQRVSKYKLGGGSLPADVSVLLLAMHLAIVLLNPCHSSHLSGLSREQLYTETKSLFSQAQATIFTSLSLIQALLLIATSEYICLSPEAAYISMSTCSGLARVLGVGKWILNAPEHAGEDGAGLVQIERENVVWAIAMTERIILAELDQRFLLPLTELPDTLSRLPSDIRLVQPPESTTSSPAATLSCLRAANISTFGRQAQAVALLDRVLYMSRTAFQSNQNIISELIQVDGQIRDFLAVVMDESRRKGTPLCTSVALSIRALFLLHQTVLNVLSTPRNEDEHQGRNFSQAALNSACKMVFDAICTSDSNPGDHFPICHYYILQAAIQHRSEQKRYLGDDTAISAELDCLLSAYKTYRCTLSIWI